jgi:peptidoglycan LD-endopeptidase LytH
METIEDIIQLKALAHPIYKNLNKENTTLFDLSIKNEKLKEVNIKNTSEFNDFINAMLLKEKAVFGIGGYLEHRNLYKRSEHFDNNGQQRCMHLGIDVWTEAYTPFFSPFEGTIHSFKDNNNFGDYGPTLIVEHHINNYNFHLLYGHLDKEVLTKFSVGKKVKAGQQLGLTGNFPENGDWPAHLHLQLILDMQNNFGDYPGVCSFEELEFYKNNCPNPIFLFNLG